MGLPTLGRHRATRSDAGQAQTQQPQDHIPQKKWVHPWKPEPGTEGHTNLLSDCISALQGFKRWNHRSRQPTPVARTRHHETVKHNRPSQRPQSRATDWLSLIAVSLQQLVAPPGRPREAADPPDLQLAPDSVLLQELAKEIPPFDRPGASPEPTRRYRRARYEPAFHPL